MILRDGDERLTLNMRHDTSSYSNQPQKESINMINIYDDSSEDFLENLFSTNHQSGNPTFSSHPELTSPEVKDNIFDLEGGNVLIEKLLDLDSTKDHHPLHHVNPLSGSTTSSSPNQLLEEFADKLALITFPPKYNDDLMFDIESDLKEIEYLLHSDPIKDMDSNLKDPIDQSNLVKLNDNLVDTMPEMFTDEHAFDYSSLPLYDEYDDDLSKVESNTEYVYDDPFDSKGEKIEESKLLINELDLPSDFFLSFEYDSFLSEDFSMVDALPSTNNEDKLAISHASSTLEDFDPPLYELSYFKEVPSDDESFSDEDIWKKIYLSPMFDEEIISMKIDPHHFNVDFDLIESLLNHDSLIISSSLKIDSLLDEFSGELTLLKSIPLGINETEECISKNSDAAIKSFSPSPIPVEDSDSFMEEIDLSFTSNDPIPPSIEKDDYDSERDILILKELLSNDSLSLPKNESFHFDIPSSSRPPAKPPDATCEQELYPFNFLLASCQESSSELQGNELGSELTSLACSELGLTSYRDTLGTTSEGGVFLRPERPRIFDDLNDNEKKRFDADVRATNILLQGLPKYIYKLINHNIEAKAIWYKIKMLLAGSELTKENIESQLYDEFEHFKMLLGENINEYYVRFHKLVNDMRNIKMTMPNIQLNSKFMNNMSPKWDRFVTAVKLNKGLKETNHEQHYAYLKQHEKYAAQDRLIIERITVTPLFVKKTLCHNLGVISKHC
nr:retrovirus-related Pol polyprotein from transposon TNT 1-94 [Tanacetum cinerariifolium]